MPTLSDLWPGAALLGLLILMIFHKPIKWLFQLLLRSMAGLAFLLLWASSGLLPSMALGANWFNALTLGFLGVPGFGLLLLLHWVTL